MIIYSGVFIVATATLQQQLSAISASYCHCPVLQLAKWHHPHCPNRKAIKYNASAGFSQSNPDIASISMANSRLAFKQFND